MNLLVLTDHMSMSSRGTLEKLPVEENIIVMGDFILNNRQEHSLEDPSGVAVHRPAEDPVPYEKSSS